MARPRFEWPCPKCGAPAGEHCRTLITNRVTDTHIDRFHTQLREALR